MKKREIIDYFTKSIIVEKKRKNGVKTKQVTSTLVTAAINMAFVNESCISSGQISKSQIIYRKVEIKPEAEIREYFRSFTIRVLKYLRIFNRNRRFLISFDETKEAFYGKQIKDPLYLHNGSIAKGSNCYYEYLTVAITCNSMRYILDSMIVPIGAYKENYVEEMIKFVKKFLPIEAALFDRGFTSWALIRILKKLKVSYIIFWEKQGNWYKEQFSELENGGFRRILRKKKYCKSNERYNINSYFVLVKQLEYTGKTYDWIFATDLLKSKSESYVKTYKKRWGIETIFRVTDDIRIYTTSVNHLKRYFLFLFTCLVYNIWKWAQAYLGEGFTLANFKTNMILFLAKYDLICPVHFDKFEKLLLGKAGLN